VFGGNAMKHFLIYLSLVIVTVFILNVNKNQSFLTGEQKPVVKIFTYSSFSNKWGPGPKLKTLFEQTCNCVVEFVEGSDSGVLLQRLKIEGQKLGADLVIGFDQFDLQKATTELSWRALDFSNLEIDPQIKTAAQNEYFVPYDWGVLTFVTRKSVGLPNVMSLDDFLKSDLSQKIALIDPRTSSVGLQFLLWVMKTKGPDEAESYLRQMLKQAHSFSPSWSTAYGLFRSEKVDVVLSYITSPLYHLVEEKSDGFQAIEIVEPQPIQVEFAGIPTFCTSCEKAEEFINLMLSPEGQKLLMEKNYMLPVLKNVKTGTPFENLKIPLRMLDIQFPSQDEIQRAIEKWTTLRREGQ
jgi:thiamine transport system substrate-binding protein